MALAKGPLTTPEATGLNVPGHVLIIPIAHTPVPSASETEEMESLRLKLTKFFEARGCHAVTFEMHHSDAIHSHWQVVAIPKAKLLEEEFIKGFAEKNMMLEKRDPGASEEYCRVVLPTGVYVATLPVRFDLQLPRRILAKILGLEERNDWRGCVQTEDEERADAAAFRQAFESEDREVTQPDPETSV